MGKYSTTSTPNQRLMQQQIDEFLIDADQEITELTSYTTYRLKAKYSRSNYAERDSLQRLSFLIKENTQRGWVNNHIFD